MSNVLIAMNVSNPQSLSPYNHRQRRFYGLSGAVKFNDYGLRIGYAVDVFEITFNRGIAKVGL